MEDEKVSARVYPAAVVLAVLTAIVCVLDLLPLIWHARNRNIAAASLIAWLIVSNLIAFINAMVWPSDNIEGWFSGVGLCDIQVKLVVGRSTALPGATFCILKSLADVMNTRRINLAPTKAERVRARAFDLTFCLAIPFISMVLHYIVQPTRYAIIGISGCNPTYLQSWITILLLNVPPLILSLAGAYYSRKPVQSVTADEAKLTIRSVLIILRLKKYRVEFSSILHASNTTTSRFLRLLILTLTFILVLFPLQIYILVLNWPEVYAPYSWSHVHDALRWKIILLFPSNGTVLPDRWIDAACGAMVFVLLGLGQEAKVTYKSWLTKVGMSRCSALLPLSRLRKGETTSATYGSKGGLFGRWSKGSKAVETTRYVLSITVV